MRHIKHSSLWVGLVIIFPLLWKGITCQITDGYSINVNTSVRVQEGLCVTIPCNFTANYSNTFNNSFGYWRLDKTFLYDIIVASNDESDPGRKTNFNLTGNPDSGDCTLTITDARSGDAGTYYFKFVESKTSAVKYDYNREAITNITVPDLTEEPVISDPGIVIAGINKTLTCTPPGNCPATSLAIQWRKNNVVGVWDNSSTVTFTPSLYDDQENITCQMTNSRGQTTEKTILLHVYRITCLPGYSIDVNTIVRVQEGLCVTIPCNFTADHRNTFSNSFGYWIVSQSNPPTIVASNDKSDPGSKPNFNLTGNPDSGDCTLTITDARREDAGEYYFRFVESNGSVKYDFNCEASPTIT